MKQSKIALLALTGMLGLILWASMASAHAFPLSEQPRVGATIKHPPSRVAIKYDSPIQKLFSKLQVLNSAGAEEASASPSVSSNQRTLSVKLKPLAPGTYKVRWVVVARDGHRTEGSYEFTVAGSDP
ncbi:MAG: copper resistance CopC family protein [Candidatus Binataceae bacterium]